MNFYLILTYTKSILFQKLANCRCYTYVHLWVTLILVHNISNMFCLININQDYIAQNVYRYSKFKFVLLKVFSLESFSNFHIKIFHFNKNIFKFYKRNFCIFKKFLTILI